MDEQALTAWSNAQEFKKTTTSTRLADIRAIEKVYGDLDDLYAQDQLQGLQAEFAYTAADKAAGRPNPSKLSLWGNVYRDLAHLRATVNFYKRFKTGASRLRSANSLPDLAAVEAAIAEYRDAGPIAFMERYGWSWADVERYALKDQEAFPSRAIVAAAGQYMASATPPEDDAVDEKAAHDHLKALGFQGEARPPIMLLGHDGQVYAPIKQDNRTTGVAAFTYRPPGASNNRDEAVEVDDLIGVARALLVDKRPVRIKPIDGGSANYLTYPGQKFARFWLRPDIAAGLGLAPPLVSSPLPLAPAESISSMTQDPTNLILFGPPGTGKTWTTASEAVRLCDGEAHVPAKREALMARYRALVAEKRIAFVTFHQSMDYETFVEGLRPETDPSDSGEAGFRLEPKPGIFREVCSLANDARTRARGGAADGFDFEGRRFWKMSLGAAGVEDSVYEAALDGDYIVMGWGGDVDWSDSRFDDANEIQREWTSVPRPSDSPSNYTQLAPFRNALKVGDLVIVPYGNSAFRAVAQVKGGYEYVPGPDGAFCHRRKVDWLLKLEEPLPLDTIIDGKFTMRTLYSIPSNRVNKAALSRLIGGDDTPVDGSPDQFVLIIDEINRANVSKVLGELITLIEPDKRLGQANELKLTLPHSRQPFGVPDNLHIVGTMNTADRSIALLDTALRRRFQFKEMAPDPTVLNDAGEAARLPLAAALAAMNDRIEYLLDRDHRIGHAYLVNCSTPAQVDAAFRDKIIPLLQEYFFEDWSRVAAVLNEKQPTGASYQGAFLDCILLKDPTGQGGPSRQSWRVRKDFKPEAYRQLAGRSQHEGDMVLADNETSASPEEADEAA